MIAVTVGPRRVEVLFDEDPGMANEKLLAEVPAC